MSEANSILSMPERAFRWYLTGLTDGEGSFVLSELKASSRQPKRSGVVRVAAQFAMLLRADDGPGLAAIRKRMGVGRISGLLQTSRSPARSWCVNRLEDLADVIVPHFDSYKLGLKKARDYGIWREAVRFLLKVKRRPRAGRRCDLPKTTPAELEYLLSLVNELRAIRTYDPAYEALLAEPQPPRQAATPPLEYAPLFDFE